MINRKNGYVYYYTNDNLNLPSYIDITNMNYCNHTMLITSDKISRRGCIINFPGYYRITEPIIFSPDKENMPSILITASDVILDFNNNSITNVTKSHYCIVIARNCTNVKICNNFPLCEFSKNKCDKISYNNVQTKNATANITDFLLAGIRVFGRTDSIIIENIHIKQNTIQKLDNRLPPRCEDLIDVKLNYGISVGEGDSFGYHMIGTNKENLVNNILISNVFVEGCIVGIHLIFTYNYEILNSDFMKNTYYSILCGTHWLVVVDDILIDNNGGNGFINNCRFIDNLGNNNSIVNPVGTDYFKFFSSLGIYYQNSLIIKKCIFANNNSDCYQSIIDVEGSSNLVIDSCNLGKSFSSNNGIRGINFSSQRGAKINTCLTTNYILKRNENIDITNIIIDKLTSTSTTGISMYNVFGGNILKCKLYNFNTSDTSRYNLEYGFLLTNDSNEYFTENVNIIDCTTINIRVGYFIINIVRNIINFNCCYIYNSDPNLFPIGYFYSADNFVNNNLEGSITYDSCKSIISLRTNNTFASHFYSTNYSKQIYLTYDNCLCIKNNISSLLDFAFGAITNNALSKYVIKNNIVVRNRSIAGNQYAIVASNVSDNYVSNNFVYSKNNTSSSQYINVAPANIVTASRLSLPANTLHLNVDMIP